ncbi:MAG: LysE family translocator [Hydrogenophaga sp.]|uniref:LysE family translocator n=1 Tax=Hydrogenophaga sp. TaxID=1904254 RepID=UPI003D10C677
MTNLLPSWPLLSAFMLASLVLAVTPGPGVVYILARSLAQGRRHGMASVAGVALGNFGNAVGAALGLAALFAVSSLAFTVVKFAGAAYLIYLGVQALRAPVVAPEDSAPAPDSLRRIFRDGFLVALLNPKTALFFAAFLPQFLVAQGSVVAQSVALGAIFVAMAALSDTAYALAAGWIAPRLTRLRRFRRAGRYLTSGTFVGLGVLAALASRRSP